MCEYIYLYTENTTSPTGWARRTNKPQVTGSAVKNKHALTSPSACRTEAQSSNSQAGILTDIDAWSLLLV